MEGQRIYRAVAKIHGLNVSYRTANGECHITKTAHASLEQNQSKEFNAAGCNLVGHTWLRRVARPSAGAARLVPVLAN